MKNVLKVEHVNIVRSKTFCLQVPKLIVQGGDILGVTGQNGCGKTTLIECLVGLLTAPSADVRVCGQPVSGNLRSTKALIGFVPDDEDWLIKELCAEEYFRLLHDVYVGVGVASEKIRYRTKYLARLLRFDAFDRQLESLSHGNKKKVQLIAGLMHEPKLIVLDEFRNGLDPLAIVAAEAIIQAEAARGAAVVAATHDLWWAERIAEHIMMLSKGSVAILGKTTKLLEAYGSIEKLFIQLDVQESSSHATV